MTQNYFFGEAMSLNITPHPYSMPAASDTRRSTPAEIPPFLQTAGRVTKFAIAAILGIVAVGCGAIGITMAPFSREAGGGAIALSTALFGVVGYLIYSETSPKKST